MANLIRMDLYRMVRSRTFIVCLLLSLVLAIAWAPLEKGLSLLSGALNGDSGKSKESTEMLDPDEGKLTEGFFSLIPKDQLQTMLMDDNPNEDMSFVAPADVAKMLADIGVRGDLSKVKPDSPLDQMLKFWGGDVQALQTELNKLTADKKSDSGVDVSFKTEITLEKIISDPFIIFGLMLMLISVCSFFYADVENGYIKNIAGQVPKKGLTIISKFAAVVQHNAIFMVTGVIGSLIGNLIVRHITAGNIVGGIGDFLLKLLLAQAVCALLVLFVSTFRNKSLGTVVAVVMGMGLMGLMYGLIDSGIRKLFPDAGDIFSKYMPDVLLWSASPDAVTSIVVSIVFIAVFLTLAIRLFDKKDVK